MPKRIEYKVGDVLNKKNNIVYIREAEPYISSGKKYRQAVCICPFCGEEFVYRINSIKNGHCIGCGCHKDLAQQKFNMLTVIKDDNTRNNRNEILWLCKCDCGNFTHVSTAHLKSGHTKSCGCLQKEAAKKNGRTVMKNLKGQRFDKLVVLKETEMRTKTYIIWECRCDCGNICYVSSHYLTEKYWGTKSCGCLKGNPKDLTGKTFGYLTAIEKTNRYELGKGRFWKFLCKCGKEVEYEASRVLSGNTQSCGCLSMSHGELKIKQILDEIKIKYKQEYYIKETNQRFDFYLFDYNCAIEFDGPQHFKEWTLGDTTLKERQEKDQIKNQYCKDNNIHLLRIPYTEKDNLNEKYIIEQLNNLDKYDYNNQNSS